MIKNYRGISKKHKPAKNHQTAKNNETAKHERLKLHDYFNNVMKHNLPTRHYRSSSAVRKKGGTFDEKSAAKKLQASTRRKQTSKHVNRLLLYKKLLPLEIQGIIDQHTGSVEFAREYFIKAIVNEDVGAVRYLINKRGINVNVIDKYLGVTPLIAALTDEKDNDDKEKLYNIVKLLLDAKAYIHATDIDENSVLHLANDLKIAKLLITNGAKIESKNIDGDTPLFMAYNVTVANLLINHNANIHATNNYNETPIFGLIKYNHSLDSIRLLIKMGAKLDHQNSMGETLLHLITKKNLKLNYNLELAKYLITVGFNKYGHQILNIENNRYEKLTPYIIFENNNNLEILEHIKTVTEQIDKKPIKSSNINSSKSSSKSSSKRSNKSSNNSSNKSSNKSSAKYSVVPSIN
tara:strand:- start:4207 stop:5427 length:1221 start_codon:yes stop_codon:yes gene_type:complete